MIGIIAAMQEELDALFCQVRIKGERLIGGITFYESEINNHDIVFLLSGIGKVAASYATTLLITNYDIEYIINTGTAGGFSRYVELYDIVVAQNLLYHDVDITHFGYQYGQMAKCPVAFPINEVLLNKISNLENSCHFGDIISGDQFINNQEKMVELVNKQFIDYKIRAVDMESAAIAHVAYLSSTPLLVIRIISDILDFDGQKDDFADIAINASKIIWSIIHKII